VGYVAPRSGMTSCKICPMGTRTNFLVAGTNCTACESGRYSDDGASYCTDCPLGYYGPPYSTANGACTACPIGYRAGKLGSVNCTECVAGKVAASTGTVNCTLCDNGKKVSSDRKVCHACPAGKYSPTAGVDCENCTAGSYSDSASTSCTDCASGFSQPKGGQSACNECPAGRRSNALSGSKNCTWCDDGKFAGSNGLAECEVCSSGSYMAPDRQGCNLCGDLEPGLTSDEKATSCEYCLKGFYRTTEDPQHPRFVDCSWLYNYSLADPLLDILSAVADTSSGQGYIKPTDDGDMTYLPYDGTIQCRCILASQITDSGWASGLGTSAGVASRWEDTQSMNDADGEMALELNAYFSPWQYRNPLTSAYNWNNVSAVRYTDPSLYMMIGPDVSNLVLKGSTTESPGGYYRHDHLSTVVYPCYSMKPAPCWPSNYSFEPVYIRNDYTYDRSHCRPGFGGPLCSVCEITYFPDSSTGFCYKCQEDVLSDIITPSLILFMIIFMAIGAFVAFTVYKMRNADDEDSEEEDLGEDAGDEPTLLEKYQWLIELVQRAQERYLKVFLNTSQILSAAETVMSVGFPPPFNQAVSALQSTSLSVSNIIPMACIYQDQSTQPTFYSAFISNTFWPLGAVAALIIDYMVEKSIYLSPAWRNGMTINEWEAKTEEERMTMRAEKVTAVGARNFNYFLVLSYLIVPGCSKMALDMLNCTPIPNKQTYIQKMLGGAGEEDTDVWGVFVANGFIDQDHSLTNDMEAYGTAPRNSAPFSGNPEEVHSYLTMDMSIDCGEDQYKSVYQPMVIMMIFIYPIGIPLIYYILLVQDDKKLNPPDVDMEVTIENRMKDPELAKTQFLWFQYKPNVYYFEVVETYRRISLTAGLTILGDSAWKRACAVFLAIVFYVWYRDVEPYQWKDTNAVSNICQFQIILTFFICLLLSIPGSYVTSETNAPDNSILKYCTDEGVCTGLSYYVPLLISVNMSCILFMILVQRSTFLELWESERMRNISRLRTIGLETDIGSMHRDVEFLMSQLAQARDLDKMNLRFEAPSGFDFHEHALPSDRFHDRNNMKVSTHRTKLDLSMVKKKEVWISRIGGTFLVDEPSPLEAQIVVLKVQLRELGEFLKLHPGNDNGEGVGDEHLVAVGAALDELARILVRTKSARNVQKGVHKSLLTPEEITARQNAQDKMHAMKRFGDELYEDRESRELFVYDEKVRTKKEESERRVRAKKEIMRLRKSRVTNFCEAPLHEGDVSFDKPGYPCYVMRLSTLIEKGLEIMNLEHAHTHEMLLGKVQWPSEIHPNWGEKLPRKRFKCTCAAVERRLNAKDYDPIKEKEPVCRALLHKLVPGGARPLDVDTYFISHQWEGVTDEPNKYVKGLTPYERRRPGSACPDNHRRTKLQWVCNLRRHFKLSEKDMLGNAREIWIWWDWLSMPVKSERQRERAVCSMPFYIQHCRNFVPLVRDMGRWTELYPLDKPPLSGPKGTIEEYLRESASRLDILLALCPKMSEWKWRAGMFNLRYRYHEDPGFCGVGRLVKMEDLEEANPVSEDSTFPCCIEANLLGLLAFHSCDKPDYYKVIHRTALQYEEYIMDGAEEWDMTAKVATKVLTETGIWSGESMDHRPQWLIDACEVSWANSWITEKLNMIKAMHDGEDILSPVHEESKSAEEDVVEDEALVRPIHSGQRAAKVSYAVDVNPLLRVEGAAKATIKVEDQGLSDHERHDKHISSIKAKLFRAKTIQVATDIGPPVQEQVDLSDLWHQHNADVGVLRKLETARRHQKIRDKMISLQSSGVVEDRRDENGIEEVDDTSADNAASMHGTPRVSATVELDDVYTVESVVHSPFISGSDGVVLEEGEEHDDEMLSAARHSAVVNVEEVYSAGEPIFSPLVPREEEEETEGDDSSSLMQSVSNPMVSTGQTLDGGSKAPVEEGEKDGLVEEESSDEEGDWIEAIDKNRGIPYYHNIETGETVWEIPEELAQLRAQRKRTSMLEDEVEGGEDSAEDEATEEEESSDEEGDWIEAIDKDRGIPYYHNIETGETVWEIPEELAQLRAERANTKAATTEEEDDDDDRL
jgi:hypothetical protein